ncbi:bifunctional hydroxymethylpyrimidine kinase/phosphomethylpyrimidine kinase [Terriglobus saanensis]|uniref:hydroxymethylpyrimidine kinase n=1 Tax=Terriglobus saanensis (strain ATCC BAA-1853 / DSM 23119 / SP1PR4) TaxID=401053 RepID=E8V6L1_TERSS|nr:bifunctional hydroxymethylpyrimidine kinase/phosphomethylpyrimidine kinase [Terriglobus saanensis]ADV82750.1 phosphomethylpyrimidine kinase [Terriglobus saanensis SP1PR4]
MKQRNDKEGESRVLLSIAGHDPGSGAGVTADLATFAAHGFFGTSCISALTVQSTIGVQRVQAMDASFLREALLCLQDDLPPAGVKIGMLGNSEIVGIVAEYLRQLDPEIPVVVDPVLRSSSGAGLLHSDAMARLRTELLPRASWITPNMAEFAVLLGREIRGKTEIEDAAKDLGTEFGLRGMVVTNGEGLPPEDFVWQTSGAQSWLPGEHIATRATHGTGCAFSSALLCGLVAGLDGTAAAKAAKIYVAEAMRRAVPRGAGRGPMHLLWRLEP